MSRMIKGFSNPYLFVCFCLFSIVLLLSTVVFATSTSSLPSSASFSLSEYRVMSEPAKNHYKLSDLANTKTTQWQKKQLSNNRIALNKGENLISFQVTNKTAAEKKIYIVLRKHLQISKTNLYVKGLDENLLPLNFAVNTVALTAGHMTLLPFSDNTLFLRVQSETDRFLNISLLDESSFHQINNDLQISFGIVVGGMAALSIAVLTLFISSGLRSIFFLLGYFIMRTLLLSVVLDGNLYFALPELAELKGIDLPIVTGASLLFLLLFSCELFNLKTKYPVQQRQLMKVVFLLGTAVIASLFLQLNNAVILSLIMHSVGMLYLVYIGLFLVKREQPLALLFTFTISLQIVFFIALIIATQYFNANEVHNKALIYGLTSWLNSCLIIFILSKQYFNKLKEKQKYQQQALDNEITMRETNETLLSLQKEHQEDLEQRVQERTLELNIALQELEESNRELAEKNTQDDLSGLYNRRFYDQKILAEYRRSKRNLTPLSIVIIDIDHFKKVNDNHGHLTGDHCIAWIGKHIKDSLKRSTDLGCRYGGEEFCLILPDTDMLGASALAEKLRRIIFETPFIYQEVKLNLTISCGVSTYQQQKDVTPEVLFSVADKALYRAKQNGRNQIQQHDFTC